MEPAMLRRRYVARSKMKFADNRPLRRSHGPLLRKQSGPSFIFRDGSPYAAVFCARRRFASSPTSCTGGLQEFPEHSTAQVLPSLTEGRLGNVAAKDGGRFSVTAWFKLRRKSDLVKLENAAAPRYSSAARSSSPTPTTSDS